MSGLKCIILYSIYSTSQQNFRLWLVLPAFFVVFFLVFGTFRGRLFGGLPSVFATRSIPSAEKCVGFPTAQGGMRRFERRVFWSWPGPWLLVNTERHTFFGPKGSILSSWIRCVLHTLVTLLFDSTAEPAHCSSQFPVLSRFGWSSEGIRSILKYDGCSYRNLLRTVWFR